MWRIGLLGGLIVAQEATWLDSRKRLPSFEAERKKAGWVWTAYPSTGYDPSRGLGVALQANVSYNGAPEDSLFKCIPYRHFGTIQVGFYEREIWYGRVGYEWLWPGGRPYRIMARTEARKDGQIQLWGVDATTLRYDLSAYTADGRLKSYYQNLSRPFLDTAGILRTREAFHRVLMRRFQLWLIGERLLMHGLLRLSFGLRYLHEEPSSLVGTSYRIDRNRTALQAPTLYDSLVTQPLPFPVSAPGPRLFLGSALVWDSRDFEVDPHRGLLLEIAQEAALTRPIYKTSLDLRAYFPVYERPDALPRLTLALHGLWYGNYGRSVPLWDLYYISSWAEARRLEALSGPALMRGYRENRFFAPFGQVYQSEIRLMIMEKNLFRQNFIGGIVAFADIGTGTNKVTRWTYPWRGNVGVGGRVLWNLQTIRGQTPPTAGKDGSSS